jgi:hypothetical protein
MLRTMFLSDLRQIAQQLGYREATCPACPEEDWAPACTACDETRRVWLAGDRGEHMLSDVGLARVRRAA